MEHALPVIFAVLSWWITTGFILWLINRPLQLHAMIGQAATGFMFIATIAIVLLRHETSTLAAYLGFSLGLVSWGWHEVMFLLGFINGPRKTPLPDGLSETARFRASAEALLHHEAMIAVHAAVLTLVSIGADNKVAALTFYALWGMRMTAKLVIFFGAPYVAEHFLPRKISYLGSYFRKSSNPMAAICGLLVTSSVAIIVSSMAFNAPPNAFSQTFLFLLTTLIGLAVFEHLALVVRIPDQALWSWALNSVCEPTESKAIPRSPKQ